MNSLIPFKYWKTIVNFSSSYRTITREFFSLLSLIIFQIFQIDFDYLICCIEKPTLITQENGTLCDHLKYICSFWGRFVDLHFLNHQSSNPTSFTQSAWKLVYIYIFPWKIFWPHPRCCSSSLSGAATDKLLHHSTDHHENWGKDWLFNRFS